MAFSARLLLNSSSEVFQEHGSAVFKKRQGVIVAPYSLTESRSESGNTAIQVRPN
jgi:hypothetical protein